MDSIIKPETIEELCSAPQSTSDSNKIPFSDSKPKQSIWKKLKSGIVEVCETLKPLIDIIVPLFGAMSTLIKACCFYRNYSNAKGGRCVA